MSQELTTIPEVEPQEELITGTLAVIEDMEAGVMPLHLRKLFALDIPEEEKEPLLSIYTGSNARKLDQYYNDTVELQGAAIIYHPPFRGKDGLTHQGYYKTYLLTTAEDERGNLVVLQSSGVGLMIHMSYKLARDGWYIWAEPIRYRVTRGDDGSHRLTNMDRPQSLRRAPRAKVVEGL